MHEEMYGGWSRERFSGADIEEITSLIEENPQERHHLEYKGGDWTNNQQWKHELAWQVASIANSSGGVLVWGVQEDEKDRTQKPTLAPTNEAFGRQRLSDILVTGVEPAFEYAHFDVVSYRHSDGFVHVIFVPQSARAPHMVVSAVKSGSHHGRYPKRSAEGPQVMLDYEVRDVMGRRQRPDLHVVAVGPVHLRDDSLNVGARLVLHNRGRAVAHHVAVTIECEKHSWESGTNHIDLRGKWPKGPAAAGLELQVTHPDQPVFPRLPVSLPMWARRINGANLPPGYSDYVALEFQTTVHSEATEPTVQRFTCRFPRSQQNWGDQTMTRVHELLDTDFEAVSEVFRQSDDLGLR
ncbi:MAG: RNA-binding domain-containing protein [Armatimonadota bacterium]